MGTDRRTDLIQISLPLLAMSAPWHGGSFAATCSTKAWKLAFGMAFVLSGVRIDLIRFDPTVETDPLTAS